MTGSKPGPASTKITELLVQHAGSEHKFAKGTRVRRITVDGEVWLAVVPADATPYLITNQNIVKQPGDADYETIENIVKLVMDSAG